MTDTQCQTSEKSARDKRKMQYRIKSGFGFGHLGNDLVATMWFRKGSSTFLPVEMLVK